MKHFFLTLAIIVTCFNVSMAQKSLSDYSFVVVPEKFEFLSKPNQYQLNDMTKYYLAKNGFNTYYFSELPSVDNCDGLWADVASIVGFTRTKIMVVLKDCKGNEVFRGETGTSKQKEYKKSYQDALRNAFLCFKELGVKQKAVAVRTKDIASPGQDVVIAPKSNIEESRWGMGPENQFNAYTYKSVAYLLKKVEGGYNLYDASTADFILKGTIGFSKSGYMGVVFDLNYQCSFLENQDLLLMGQDGVSLTLVFQN
jgi:hypothetical protein